MSIPTLTANPASASGVSGTSGVNVPPDLPAPAGLPDAASLARLATEFFRALPGAVSIPGTTGVAGITGPGGAAEVADAPAASALSLRNGAVTDVPSTASSVLPAIAPLLSSVSDPAPPGSPLAGPGGTGTGIPGATLPQGKAPGANLAPSSPAQVLTLGNRAPALVPHAVAQNGVPDHAVSVAPALAPRAGGSALGVPEANGLGLGTPHARTVASAASASQGAQAAPSPFYFLDDATRTWPGAPELHVPTHVPDDFAPGLQQALASPHAPDLSGERDLAGEWPLQRSAASPGPSAPANATGTQPAPHSDEGATTRASLADAAGAQPAPWASPPSWPSARSTAWPGAPLDTHSAPYSPYSLYVLDEALAATPPRDASATSGALASPFASAHPPFDVNAIRRDFPILQERVNGRPLIWFDNAATTHKPQAVIDRLAYFYAHENSNIHRAAHTLAARATDAYEAARATVQRFIGASSPDEIVFVRGTTEAINLIAKTWGVQNVGEGDEIVLSHLEHHANIVPWQQLAAQTGAVLRVIPVDEHGQVLLDEYRQLLNDRTKLVSVTQVSNALGTVVPVAQIVEMAHRAGAKALVDGAQSVSHMRTDVQALDADFFVFSGHKIYGPTGIGVVYGKRDVLETMPPWQGGGNMIVDVTFERTVFHPPPGRFEAGTGNIADAVGLGAALDYVSRVGIDNIARYEHDLLDYATRVLAPVPGVRIVGTAREKASVLSFVLKGYTTEEVGRALSDAGIAVRAGHHCAQPILRRFGLETSVRPSLAFYNTCAEVDALVDVVRHLAARREK